MYMHKQWSPGEIQTPTQWNLIGRSITAPFFCVIAQQYSSHLHAIALSLQRRKIHRAFQKYLLHFYFLKISINVKLRDFNCVTILRKFGSVRQSHPITGLYRPLRFQEVEVLRFPDNRHMKVVRLSALRTSRLYPPFLLETESTLGP
jgi:hypothetical protein